MNKDEQQYREAALVAREMVCQRGEDPDRLVLNPDRDVPAIHAGRVRCNGLFALNPAVAVGFGRSTGGGVRLEGGRLQEG